MGSSRHQTPSTRISISANQKLGMACPKTAIHRHTRSSRLFGLSAATTSSGIDSAIAKARSEEHTSELQSLMRISYAVFCLKKKSKNRPLAPPQTNNHTVPSLY